MNSLPSTDQPMVLEVNRQPDFECFERASKFDVETEVVKYICQRVGEQGMESS